MIKIHTLLRRTLLSVLHKGLDKDPYCAEAHSAVCTHKGLDKNPYSAEAHSAVCTHKGLDKDSYSAEAPSAVGLTQRA